MAFKWPQNRPLVHRLTDSGAKPVRVAANSRVTPPTTNFFIGSIDEVRVWNDDLTATQQASAFAGKLL